MVNIVEEKLQDYLIIPAEHVEHILAEWLNKHFGHILSGRTDTAEYGRIINAHNDLKATLVAKVVPSVPAESSLPIEVPVIDVPVVEATVVPGEQPDAVIASSEPVEIPQETVVEAVVPVEVPSVPAS